MRMPKDREPGHNSRSVRLFFGEADGKIIHYGGGCSRYLRVKNGFMQLGLTYYRLVRLHEKIVP